MKIHFALAALLFLTAGAAQAGDVMKTLETDSNGFVKQYTLDTFKIAPQSEVFAGITPGTGGVYLDEANRTLRIAISPSTNCPPNTNCNHNREALFTLPFVLDLPVTYIGSPFCGGRVISAENDMRREDGALVKVQVLDENGSACEPGTDGKFVKRVTVTVTEQAARSDQTLTSVLTGFPVQRLTMDMMVRD
jgi:hypothetical protein